MKIIWKAPDDAPPPKGAIEWAVRVIAQKAGLVVPEDATIVLDNEFVVGSYSLVQAVGPDDEICWFVQYERVLDELIERTDAEMRAAGEDPSADDFERQVYRLVRRQLIHWPEEQVRELRAVLIPIMNEMLHNIMHEGHDHED